MTVRFMQPWRGGYWPGDVATFDDATEAKIVAAGAGEIAMPNAETCMAEFEARGVGPVVAPVTKPAPRPRGRPPKAKA